MLQKIKSFVLSHKIIIGIILIGLVVGIYFIFKGSASGETRYITEIVKKGGVTTTVTGTGQVEALDTITLKSKTSGDITYVPVKVGDTVKKGALIASVDARDAKVALENARISLQKLIDVDPLTLLKEENSLKVSYDSGWNKVSSYITDTTDLLDGMKNIFNNDGYLGYKNTSGIGDIGREKVSFAEDSYYDAKNSLEELIKVYKTLSRSDSNEKIKNLIDMTYKSSILIATSSKDVETAFNYVVESIDEETNSTTVISNRSDISSWLNTSNGYANSLLSVFNGIDEGEKSLIETKAGADELDIRSSQLSVQSKLDAYNNCFVYAPFDGVIATLIAKVGEASGSSIGTIITKQKIATISLNEVDIASIKLGQKVSLTFDAIDNLTIDGEVVEIDSIGTVSQGVVTYNIKISFNEIDDRVKSGMSVSATIITNIVQDVLAISNSAIKTQKGMSYVEMFDSPLGESFIKSEGATSINPPKQIKITTGLVDDTKTEITSGLKEGDIIVTKTIISVTSTTKSTTPSLLNAVGGNKTTGARSGGFAMPHD